MPIMQITPNLPPVWGPYGEVDDGARYFTAAGVGPLSDPYEQRTAITLHSVNGLNLTRTTAVVFFRNHFTEPGDRENATPGRHHGVSYHVIVGADASIVVALDERAGTLSAGSLANQRFVHIVLMHGNWQTMTAQHEVVFEALAQFVATLCIGFKIPARWCAVDPATSPDVSAEERMANALLLINDTRTPIGLLGHRDITAAYQLLRRHPDARIRARATRIKNSHSDVQYFPGRRFAARVQEIIEGDEPMRIIKVDGPGEHALFSVAVGEGNVPTVRYLTHCEEQTALQRAGVLDSTTRVVAKADLRWMHLVGPEPPPSVSTVKGSDFAGWAA